MALSAAACTAEEGGEPPAVSANQAVGKDAEFFKDTPERYRPFVAACDPWDDWDKPAPPYKIYGATYYVGTCGIAAILVQAPEGLVLFDSGTEAGSQVVLDNIRALGFDPSDVTALLYSHEHFDHVGGMANVQEATGAPLYAAPDAAAVLRTGKDDPRDPQAGMHDPMQPIANVTVIDPDKEIALAGKTFRPIATPGHTLGALSWAWEDCEKGAGCLTIGYADSLSPISRDGYRFSDHPDLLKAHEAGLEALALSDCSLLLTPHPSSSRMLKRMRRGKLIADAACAYYAQDRYRAMEERLNKEAASTP